MGPLGSLLSSDCVWSHSGCTVLAGCPADRTQVTGLDAAGKTTLLERLRPRRVDVETVIPSIGLNFAFLRLPTLTLCAWSCTPQTGSYAIPFLKKLLPDAAALVFLVDSGDWVRFDAAAEQLHSLLNQDTFAGVPLLVLANKTDRPDAASTEAISTAFRLADIHGRVVLLRSCSMESGEGVDAAMAWLTDAVVL